MTIEGLYQEYKACGCRVTTDSRAISGGEMFIALKGDNFDGNEYALKALEAGERAPSWTTAAPRQPAAIPASSPSPTASTRCGRWRAIIAATVWETII